ncbi:hypothetical protein ACLOJK_010375 [Asimina triloba]
MDAERERASHSEAHTDVCDGAWVPRADIRDRQAASATMPQALDFSVFPSLLAPSYISWFCLLHAAILRFEFFRYGGNI